MRIFLLVVGLLAAVGCGVTEADVNETSTEMGEELGELGTTTRSYVVLRRDTRRCVSPMCGGYFVRDVNRASNREVYVNGLDFKGSDIVMPEAQQVITGAADFEVVLYGKLGAQEPLYKTRSFVVTSGWRGMPGVAFAATDVFYKVSPVSIQCFAAPCPSLSAQKLHSSSKILFHDVDVARAAKPYVDQNWMTSRITDKGALVAGRLVEGAQVGVGKELVLDASQVFVKIPDVTQSCPRPSIMRCPGEQVHVWVRDTNRCLMPAGCVTAGACAAFVPTCADGYQLASWTGGMFACTQYACDPEFLFNE